MVIKTLQELGKPNRVHSSEYIVHTDKNNFILGFTFHPEASILLELLTIKKVNQL